MALMLVSPVWAGESQQLRRDLDKNKEGLNIALVLNERELEKNDVFPEPYNYMRLVKDAKFVRYGIDVFERSIYRNVSAADYSKLSELVASDAKAAIAKEVIYREGRLIYALLQMPPVGRTNRFVAFQGGGADVTVVYMEGKATLDELEKIFVK